MIEALSWQPRRGERRDDPDRGEDDDGHDDALYDAPPFLTAGVIAFAYEIEASPCKGL